MPRNVVAFVGQNENGILRETSLEQMCSIETFGFTGHVIDLHDPDWTSRFDKLLREGIAFGWGHAGIGSNLAIDGRNVWDAIRVPFVSTLSDHPCWLPHAHRPEFSGIVLAYVIGDWLDVQQRFVQAPNVYGRIPSTVSSNPYRDRTPWSRRSNRMVFVKTGECPATRRANWAHYPRRFRAVLEDAADQACRHGTMGLTDLLMDCLAAHGLLVDGRTDLLFALMTELDLYVRAERGTRMAQALSRLPALIIGRGWDHIDRTSAKATFAPAIDASRLPELMADTQFWVNTNPNFSAGVHERVLCAFAARTCAVTDLNDYYRENFAGFPTFFGLDWHTDDLADRLADIFASEADFGPATEPALQCVDTAHAQALMTQALVDLAELGRLAMNLP